MKVLTVIFLRGNDRLVFERSDALIWCNASVRPLLICLIIQIVQLTKKKKSNAASLPLVSKNLLNWVVKEKSSVNFFSIVICIFF